MHLHTVRWSVRLQSEPNLASVQQGLTGAEVSAAGWPPAQSWKPVLGIGSNGSPEQLARKFPVSKFPQAVIPTVRCALHDFDVVYAPLISSYGSCTGIIPAPHAPLVWACPLTSARHHAGCSLVIIRSSYCKGLPDCD